MNKPTIGPTFDTLEEMIVATADAVRPPERISVSEAGERYHIVKNPGQHEGPFSYAKTPYLREPSDVLTSLDFMGMVFAGPARTGKALALDTPIATPSGWTTMGEIRVGDTVFDEKGDPCTVLAATDTMLDHDCYRIEFDDGNSIVADAGHKWRVDDIHGVTKIRTTKALLDTACARRSRYAIPTCGALFGEWRFDLPVEPYLLGAWLGDGSSSDGYLTLNEWDLNHITSVIEAAGADTSNRTHYPKKSCWSVRVSANGESLRTALMRSGLLNNKHIPEEYLRASEYQRRELLRGIMDTDGHAIKKQPTVEWSTSFPRLMVGVEELLASLGIKFTTSLKTPYFRTTSGERKAGNTSYRICFTPDNPQEIFSLPRQIKTLEDGKAKRKSKPGHTRRRWIREIVQVQSVPVRCISVSSASNLFLAGRAMIPTHNSAMALNWLCHTAITDPADYMIVQMSQTNARDWSLSDLAKALRNSPELKKRLVPGRQNDNVFDKAFLSGMRLTVTWPTISNLSGKTIPRLWIMDLDRIKPQIIDKEGHVFDLTKKRAGTFKRYGMIGAEASPGFPITDPKWMPQTPHEAPPCEGILSIYNRGDRRRWYWQCPHCDNTFEPRFSLLRWPETGSQDIMETAEQTYMACPHCFDTDGALITYADSKKLNAAGRWIKEGQTWLPSGEITGTARRSDIASFWMFGPAAGFTDWSLLVRNYLTAGEEFERTGDEGPLMTTVTVDQGEAYLPKAMESGRLPETLKSRAEDWGTAAEEPTVPPGVRFLLAMIDVQDRSFVVHVFGVDENRDIWHVDMFKIRKSDRISEQGDREDINPGSYQEDWQKIRTDVMEKSYLLGDGSGRRMGIKLTACDSGGRDGVTATAYEFYLKLRAEGQHQRLHLLKGVPSKNETAPIRIAYPNAQSKGNKFERYAAVPVYFVNSNIVKDNASNLLERTSSGGQIHFPWWAPDWLYSQLTNEIRLPNGEWENPGKRRNEAWDLLCYALAFLDHRDINIRYLDWTNPPSWAAEWDRNDFVFADGAQAAFDTKADVGEMSFEDIARNMA